MNPNINKLDAASIYSTIVLGSKGAEAGGMFMTDDLSQAVRGIVGIDDSKGRKRFKVLYQQQVAARVEEQQSRLEALEGTVKTLNQMGQLAAQQIHVLTTQIKELRSLPSPHEENGDAESTEVEGK